MFKTLLKFVASWFFVIAATAHAEIPTVGATSSIGTPGGHVILELAYDYGSGFEVALDEFKVQYDGRVLGFVAGSSTVERGGTEASWLDFIGELGDLLQGSPGSFGAHLRDDAAMAPQQAYVLSFYTLGDAGQPRSGIERNRLWFDVAATAEAGTTNVAVEGVMYDFLEQEFSYPASFSSPGIPVNVTAVPEPGRVLLLLAGLAIVAARFRGRTGWMRAA